MSNPPLKTLSDAEVDKIAAELLGMYEGEFGWYINNEKQFHTIEQDYDLSGYDLWNPTANAQQIQDYVFPKLKWNVTQWRADDDRRFEITLTWRDQTLVWHEVRRITIDMKQINRITCEACIEALWNTRTQNNEEE